MPPPESKLAIYGAATRVLIGGFACTPCAPPTPQGVALDWRCIPIAVDSALGPDARCLAEVLLEELHRNAPPQAVEQTRAPYLTSREIRPTMQQLAIDAVSAAYRPGCDPGIVISRDPLRSVVAVFDACGTWGNGMEAAAWARSRLASRWRNSGCPPTIDSAVRDVLDVVATIPATLREGDFECTFDGVIALVEGERVYIAAAGAHGVALVGPAKYVDLFRPRTLLEDARSKGDVDPALGDHLASLDVCVGPYLACPATPNPFTLSGPHELALGDTIVVAYRRLMQVIGPKPSTSWVGTTAAEFQATLVRERNLACPIVTVRHQGVRAGHPEDRT
jgi:hypothetical protein